MVPYIVPGIVMGIAIITRFNGPPLELTGTGLVIVLAVFIRRLPYSARSSAAALKQLSPSLEEAADQPRLFARAGLPAHHGAADRARASWPAR